VTGQSPIPDDTSLPATVGLSPDTGWAAAVIRPCPHEQLQRAFDDLGVPAQQRRCEPATLHNDGNCCVVVDLGPAAALSVERAAAGIRAAAKALGASMHVTVDLVDIVGRFGAQPTVRATVGAVLDTGYGYGQRTCPARLTLGGLGPAAAERSLRVVAEQSVRETQAVFLARDLVNAPPSRLDPATLAERAGELAATSGLTADCLGVGDLQRERMGGILAVGQGSSREPRLVLLSYEPDEASPGSRHIALVGKGITFDSGGLSLKDPDDLMNMKSDMAGAAAVLAAMTALHSLGVQHRVSAYLPLAENIPGPDAARVGDVARTRSGLTIEILNTDFEGRILLSDALTVAAESDPDAVIDLATLTESAVLALGPEIAALFGTDEPLLAAVESASLAAGEPVWRMPLADRYADQLESDMADLRNFPGSRFGRSITAALFLRAFVGPSVPWAHLDISGPAWRGGPGGAGGTGFGTRLLLRLLSTDLPARAPTTRADRPRPSARLGTAHSAKKVGMQ
jgi:leucyl aminopeptidase